MPTSEKRDRSGFTPSQRRDELRLLLRSGWQTLPAIMERLGASRTTTWRRLKELGETDPLEQDGDGHRSLWRLPPDTKDHALRVSTVEMVALRFVKGALGFLAETGIKEDIDAVLGRISHALKASDYAHYKNLDRKLHDVNEGVMVYGEATMDVMNDVITALLHEERLAIVHDGAKHEVDPYSLVLYKKALYLVGHSHTRKAIRTFGFDKMTDSERLRGVRFDYPKDFDPKVYFQGPFGIIRGPKVKVVARFDDKVAHYVTRRAWHPTQKVRKVEGGIEVTMEPEGTNEMVSWLLGFGANVEVLEPAELRERVAKEARGAAARYA